MDIKPFVWQVQYYETDQMGIVHHSNDIRWMESARLDYLRQIGLDYAKLESEGVISPVLSVSCEYKSMVRFQDRVSVEVRIEEYNGIRLLLSYRILDAESGKVRTLGKSSHCFLTKEGRPLSLARSYPEWDQKIKAAMEQG